MCPRPTQSDILHGLAEDARAVADISVSEVVVGSCLVAVLAGPCGLATLASHHAGILVPPASWQDALGQGAFRLVERLKDHGLGNSDEASLAMAALNALLPSPATDLEHPGQQLIIDHGKGKNVALIGHFPFVPKVKDTCANLWVLEKRPKPGDIRAEEADQYLPRADVVALTGTTLLNGTLAGLLALCRPETLVVMLGPTTPFAPSLFTWGIDVLAGCEVVDAPAALAGIRQGSCFKGLSGVRQTAWARPGLRLEDHA